MQRHAHSYFPKYLWNDDQHVTLDGQTYAQNLIATDTLDWVKAHAGAPFFLFHALTLPHGDFEIDDLGLYKDKPWSKLAGVELKSPHDGISVVALLKGGHAPPRQAFYWEWHEGTSLRAVRFGDWKAVRNRQSKPLGLCDLKTDVSESKNLYVERSEIVVQAEHWMKTLRQDHPDWPLIEKPSKAKKQSK